MDENKSYVIGFLLYATLYYLLISIKVNGSMVPY